ncbi:MAG: hypothetical protein ABI697_00065 [Devosia sp.]
MLALADAWVWDFWLAEDAGLYHCFFLHAPKALGDANLRHRNARIGHASSRDLVHWTEHAVALAPSPAGAFDDTATWTGSVLRGPDGLWRLFYTGAHFLSPDAATNIETIGVATSPDLFTWTKLPGPIVRADARWYETLGTSAWPEEAWRDPWVFADPDGEGWHMLVTARANAGDEFDRGVVGHAVSTDLETWQVRPPLSQPHSGFAHIEVTQVIEIGGRIIVLFCCDAPRLAGPNAGGIGGIWWAPAAGPVGPFDIAAARLLLPETWYAGRAVKDPEGRWVLLAFSMRAADGSFPGTISDPMPLGLDADGNLLVLEPATVVP